MATHRTSLRRHLPEMQQARTTISAHAIPPTGFARHREPDPIPIATPVAHVIGNPQDDAQPAAIPMTTHTNTTVEPSAHPASRPSLVSRRLKCSFSSTSDQVRLHRSPPESTQIFVHAHTHAAGHHQESEIGYAPSIDKATAISGYSSNNPNSYTKLCRITLPGQSVSTETDGTPRDKQTCDHKSSKPSKSRTTHEAQKVSMRG